MKKIIQHNLKAFAHILLAVAIVLTGIPMPVFGVKATVAEAASPVVEKAISWAVSIANDNSHGYSQSSRWGPDYDCSSFVISAFKNAGVNVGTATYTGNMRSQFTQHGFQWIPWSQIGGVSNLQRGDILLNEKTHTEIYLGGNQNVGAHSSRGYPQTGDQTGTEVSVSGYYYHPWDGVLRYAGSDVCNCSTDYAGDYYVTTDSLPLTMRSGHGTGYSAVASIPRGSSVYVSRADGNWAHVEWNGYSGYCSMTYLTKITSKNYNLHVWVSETGMGDVPSDFVRGKRYYICYELIDTSTGKRANETSSINYSATETVRNSNGKVFEHTYQNSDYNWIWLVCDSEDTYTGTVTISGDVNVSASVSFDVYADTVPQIKVWAWENDDSKEISTIDIGKTAYCSYLIRDKNTERNLNDVTTFWTKGNGYTITINVYDPSGNLIKTQSYKNNDCTWFSFVPEKLGDYKIRANVTGNLSGGYERTIKAEEKEHLYSVWKITKNPDCMQTGTKTRTCSICNKIQTETIPALGHTIVKDKSIAATCTREGRTEGEHCSVCGKIITEQKIVPKVRHTYNSNWKSNVSSHWRECICGEKGEEASHTFLWVTDKLATATETGLKHEECIICGFGRSYNTVVNKIVSEQPVSPTPTVKPTVTPTATVKPIVTPASTVEPIVMPTATVRPIVTPMPTVMPTDTVEPMVTPVPTIMPTATVGPEVTPIFTIEPLGTPEVLPEILPEEEPEVIPVFTTEPLSTPEVLPEILPTEEPADTQEISPNLTVSVNPTVLPVVSPKPANEPLENYNQSSAKIGKVKVESFTNQKKGKVYLKWRNVKGAGGYQIQYSLKKTFSTKQTKSTKGCSIILKGLRPKKKYYIRVRAYSQGENRRYGNWSKVNIVKMK